MVRQLIPEQFVLNAKATTGVDNPVNVEGFRHLVVSFATADSANLTVKFQSAISEDAPDFTAAQTVANMYDFVEVNDTQDSSITFKGDLGVSVTGTDDFRLFRVNVDNIKWFSARVTARSAGSVTCKVKIEEN